MPNHQNITTDDLTAFYAGGKTITYCEPSFAVASPQSTLASTRRAIARQRSTLRREQRATRERERLAELYGASDPFALAASYQLG